MARIAAMTAKNRKSNTRGGGGHGISVQRRPFSALHFSLLVRRQTRSTTKKKNFSLDDWCRPSSGAVVDSPLCANALSGGRWNGAWNTSD